jgi:predicted acyltransferase
MVYERFFGAAARPFRFGSVLARIGIAGAAASVLYVFFRVRTRVAIAVAILVGYWALTVFMGAPDHPGASHFSPEGNIAVYVDRTFLSPWSRLSPGTAALPFDNQGLLSTVAAVVTAMLGMFTGEYVRATRGRVSGDMQTAVLLAAAAMLAVVGCAIAWCFGSYSFPFSKVLWSPSFTLVVGAYSVAAFAVFYWLIDVRGVWRRTMFFRVIGLNAITIYLAQPLLSLSTLNTNLFGRLAGWFTPSWGAVFLGATYMLVCWLLLYVMYRKSIFLKV